jgi:hypothetical protein
MVTYTLGEVFRSNTIEANLAMATAKVKLNPSEWKHLRSTEWRRSLVEDTTP